MVQGIEASNLSQILSPLSLMYQAVCRGLVPVWLARTYFELASSDCFFSDDLVVNPEWEKICYLFMRCEHSFYIFAQFNFTLNETWSLQSHSMYQINMENLRKWMIMMKYYLADQELLWTFSPVCLSQDQSCSCSFFQIQDCTLPSLLPCSSQWR